VQPAPLVTYIRVSTSGQGRSGLGIEAQRQALTQFAQAEGFELAREFVEVETGKGSDALDRRPQLKAALAAARKLRGHVAVAKLDRLSRDVHFISGLMAHNSPSWSPSLAPTLTHSSFTCSPRWPRKSARSFPHGPVRPLLPPRLAGCPSATQSSTWLAGTPWTP
jgi:hypothetical protein